MEDGDDGGVDGVGIGVGVEQYGRGVCGRGVWMIAGSF